MLQFVGDDGSLEAEAQAATEEVGVLMVEARAQATAWVARTSATEVTYMPLPTSDSVDPKNLDSL